MKEQTVTGLYVYMGNWSQNTYHNMNHAYWAKWHLLNKSARARARVCVCMCVCVCVCVCARARRTLSKRLYSWHSANEIWTFLWDLLSGGKKSVCKVRQLLETYWRQFGIGFHFKQFANIRRLITSAIKLLPVSTTHKWLLPVGGVWWKMKMLKCVF